MKEHCSPVNHTVPVELIPNKPEDYRFQANIAYGIVTRDRQIQAQAETLKTSEIDALTGLFRKNLLVPNLNELLSESRDNRHTIALAFVDGDGLKGVNDRFGHSTGDKLIATMAEGIHKVTRRNDKGYLYGGDEFVLVMDLGNLTELISYSDPTDQSYVELSSLLYDRVNGSVNDSVNLLGLDAAGASTGIALSIPGDTALDLLSRADAAMYDDKQSKRSEVPALVA